MTPAFIRGAMLAAALLTVPSSARAQAASHADHHGAAPTAQGMKSPCPLHLTTLGTTPAQDSAIARIREAHMAEMKAMHAGHDAAAAPRHMPDSAAKARMKAGMDKALDDMRAVLTDAQRQQLDAAVAAHDAEKAALAKSGTPHDCAACCAQHERHRAGGAAAHHEH